MQTIKVINIIKNRCTVAINLLKRFFKKEKNNAPDLTQTKKEDSAYMAHTLFIPPQGGQFKFKIRAQFSLS